MTKLTSRTIINKPDLLSALKVIGVEQIGIDDEEFIEGMVAVAVPIFSSAGVLLGTLAVHARSASKDIDKLRSFIPRLNEASASLAEIFESEC